MHTIQFANQPFLYALVIPALMLAWYIFRQGKTAPALRYSHLGQFASAPQTWRNYLRHVPYLLRVAAVALLIVVLARPQTANSWEESNTEGINIMMVLDVSSSMLAEDFQPNRLEAAKNIASEFTAGRTTDRMGLVVFSAESFTQCPLTADKSVLVNYFSEVKSGMLEDGTAIGVGLANAVNRLKKAEKGAKVAILLTDGENNKGEISPKDAAEIAKTLDVRVYTIGVGSMGTAPYPVQTPFGRQYRNVEVRIDEPTLKQIAETTGGEYFRATDNQSLKKIYQEIDQLEKAKISVRKFSTKSEEFASLALWALALLALEALFRFAFIRQTP